MKKGGNAVSSAVLSWLTDVFGVYGVGPTAILQREMWNAAITPPCQWAQVSGGPSSPSASLQTANTRMLRSRKVLAFPFPFSLNYKDQRASVGMS
jgi:hypothetical protein